MHKNKDSIGVTKFISKWTGHSDDASGLILMKRDEFEKTFKIIMKVYESISKMCNHTLSHKKVCISE
jgi:hypothetical protein